MPLVNMLPRACLFALALVFTTSLTADAASCSSDEDCSALQNAVCSSGECACPDEYFVNDDYTRCLPPAVEGYGASCEAASQCAGRMGLGPVCDGACACAAGYHYLHGVCTLSAGLGESCSEDADCFSNHASYTLRCSQTTSTCECADGAYAWNGVCRLKATGEGDACYLDEDCSAADSSLVCANNICSRTAARSVRAVREHTEPRAAAARPRVGEACSAEAPCAGEAEQCSLLGTCVCSLGYFTDSDGVCKRELGEACSSDADCEHVANARCGVVDSATGLAVCHCGPRWAPDPGNNFCRLGRKMNYSCAVDANCFNFGEGGVCQDYKCACAEGTRFVEEEAFCWPIRSVGENCSADLDCYYEGSACGGDGVCGCGEGYHLTTENTCLKDVTALGDACLSNADCSGVDEHAACDQQVCVCDADYVQTADTTCALGVGGACTQDADCSAVAGAICNDTCKCNPGDVLSTAGDACLTEAQTEGDECVEATQCVSAMGDSAECSAGKCSCPSGTHYQRGSCWLSVSLGGSCNRSLECYNPVLPEAVECLNGECSCGYDYLTGDDNYCHSGALSRLQEPVFPLLAAAMLALRALLAA